MKYMPQQEHFIGIKYPFMCKVMTYGASPVPEMWGGRDASGTVSDSYEPPAVWFKSLPVSMPMLKVSYFTIP